MYHLNTLNEMVDVSCVYRILYGLRGQQQSIFTSGHRKVQLEWPMLKFVPKTTHVPELTQPTVRAVPFAYESAGRRFRQSTGSINSAAEFAHDNEGFLAPGLLISDSCLVSAG
jgi:hypothetical protein